MSRSSVSFGNQSTPKTKSSQASQVQAQTSSSDAAVLNERMMQQMQQIQQLTSTITQKKQNEQKFNFEYLGIAGISRGDIVRIFGSIRCIIICGPEKRARLIAEQCVHKVNIAKESEKIDKSQFFSVFKVGPVLSCSHGMGLSSVSIFLNELFRIMQIAKNTDFHVIRVGSSGGIGVAGGTLLISTHALDAATLKPEWTFFSCGTLIKQECVFNAQIAKRLFQVAKAKKYAVEYGKTVSTETYYEAQARLDGALCEYTEQDKNKYLQKLHKNGVRNFEMEGMVLAGMSTKIGIKTGMVCVAYLDRLKEDTVSKHHTKQELDGWMNNAIDVVLDYIVHFVINENNK